MPSPDSQRRSQAQIYRYIVRFDDGAAPRPFDGVCSLAICKPVIRKHAEVGDWVIGFRSHMPGEVVFVMKVDERLPLGDYWADRRFINRRPGRSAVPDNFYRWGPNGRLIQVPNLVHSPRSAAKDCRGQHVLLGRRFWYFGRNSVPVPNELVHLVHSTRGHSVHKSRRPDDVGRLERWLRTWRPGRHGMPIDAPRSGLALSAAAKRIRHCDPGPRRRIAVAARPSCEAFKQPTRRATSPRKLVLSRKGFDAENGGIASPILPDGRLLPLPIPGRREKPRMADLDVDRELLAKLLSDLTRRRTSGRVSVNSHVHLDPDLAGSHRLGLKGWRPSLGQTGIAQGHLASEGVGAGDVFLFFGWFRRVHQSEGRWEFVPGSPDIHLMFGWLEIGRIVPVMTEGRRFVAENPWIADHPHVASRDRFQDEDNMLYVASPRSSLAAGCAGGGLFPYFRPELQLTRSGSSRSIWRLPSWFMPGRGRAALTYHQKPERWNLQGAHCELQSVAKGQEFVLDLDGRPHARPWLKRLITAGASPAPSRRR